MRHLLTILAILGVVLGCSLALASDAGPDTPTPPAIDAGVDSSSRPDAGPYRTTPPPDDKETAAPAGGDEDGGDELDDELGVLRRAYLAIRNGDHVARELAALGLILISLLVSRLAESEKYGTYIPSFFETKRGRYVLTGLLAALGALGHQALASSFGDWEIWKAAGWVFVEASFGYVSTKSLLNLSRDKDVAEA